MTDEVASLDLVRQGDTTALSAVFDANADRLFRLASHLLRDSAEAEDVVQQAFVALLTHREGFDGRSRIGTWLYRVAYNACVDRLRARRRVAPGVIDDEAPLPMPASFAHWQRPPDEQLIDAQTRAHIDAALHQLPESLRVVVLLRDVEEASTAETAEALGISEGAVKVRLHRARLLLRERLAGVFGRARTA
jgi:RNA polymerase sigma-70 factor (ECF subfamily)